MNTAIKIVFLVMLVLFSLSFIGEKDKDNKFNYMLATFITAVLTILIFKYLK